MNHLQNLVDSDGNLFLEDLLVDLCPRRHGDQVSFHANHPGRHLHVELLADPTHTNTHTNRS